MLIVIWGLSLVTLITLFTRGYLRLHLTPVSYEFHWNPVHWMSVSLSRWFQEATASVKAGIYQLLHRIFHTLFHLLKRFHDRIFGKRAATEVGAPSFFLKTIAEHKEEHTDKREMLS